jgi:FSR family fosmidomycin resistance protein-like MFS transporter
LIRHDLRLDYGEIGLLLALPGLFGSLLDPVVGVAGDGRWRRALVVAGAVGFAVSTALSALATGFVVLLVALLIGNPSAGAFVSLAQATLMDRAPAEREQNMARWTVAGSIGYVAGPLLIAAGVASGGGWRAVLLLLAVPALPLAVAARSPPPSSAAGGSYHRVLRALRTREVLRWLLLLEATDLLGDILHGLIALYLVDVTGATPLEGALAVAVWTGAAFAGDVLLLVLLRHIDSRTWLRLSAALALAAYPLFLLVPSLTLKLALLAALGLLDAGWYALPKAALYGALPGGSGTAVAVGGIGGAAGAAIPAALGALAGAVGLGATMWVLLLAPVALLTGVGRRRAGVD